MTSGYLHADIFANYIRAGRRDADPGELRELAKSTMEKIRMRVAENPSAPEDVLATLAQDPHADVRIAVGSNSSASSKLMRLLARDPDPTVRYSIAESLAVEPVLLNFLANDPNPYVSVRARKTLSLLPPEGIGKRRCNAGLRLLQQETVAHSPELQFA